MLSRLLSANNPETGLICYGLSSSAKCSRSVNGYDANGNLSAKTDARGITTTYLYDTLNRPLSKVSSGYLSSCYHYEGGESNGLGRLANEWTQAGTCSASVPASGTYTLRSILGYDPMGRITGEQQCRPGNCTTSSGPQLSYAYDVKGNQTSLSNSVGLSSTSLTLTTSFDAAGHMQSISSNWPTSPMPGTPGPGIS